MADSDPTQQGGQEEKLSPEEQIAARVNAAQAEDQVALDVDENGDLALPKGDTANPAPSAAAPVAQVTANTDAAAAPQPPKMVSIVVDGQTIEVEESRILEAGKRTLQKDQAADRRLQEATETRRRAEEFLRQAQGLSPKPDAPQQQPAPSQDAPPATFSPEMLEQVLENKLYNRDATKAAAKFKDDFPEIAADPHLMNMAATLENQRLSTVTALGESYGDPFEAYRKHGESIRDWLGKYKPAPVSEDKVERKRTITAVPAINAKAPQPQEEKPQTVQQIIAEERKARLGRPNPNRSH